MSHDLGELTAYTEKSAFTFTVDGHPYAVAPTAAEVLRFRAAVSGKQTTDLDLLQFVPPLLGSAFDPETGTFSGGVLADLTARGVDFNIIDRVLSATFLYFWASPDAAINYAHKGSGTTTDEADTGDADNADAPEGKASEPTAAAEAPTD
ncbi:hypothetical protein C1Y63_04700 [Corynebacterium sp. 13CS0277]|uniref:DUF7426 family protein n=1 Tax=Corynebacterium sp. 13CS0277 TaxID=2071994 RepID=UPI000D02526F|nr:hypothetical protein [Corynebacterium sp. 13CS0277]PRQ11711.1 hypothetical protein C1Y63_04700 [Corynebacterium sp. 13CS0277]